jgi:hypothetical protein
VAENGSPAKKDECAGVSRTRMAESGSPSTIFAVSGGKRVK